MSKEVDYKSLKGEFNSLKGNIKKNNFRGDIRDALKSGWSRPYTKEGLLTDKSITYILSEINDYASRGIFDDVKKQGLALQDSLEHVDGEDKLKYLKSLSKRIDRASNLAIKYLRENKNEIPKERMNDIQELIKYGEGLNAEVSQNGKSGLEKSLTVLSIGSVLAGIFFLSPNLTGNVIGNVTKSSGNIFGGILFILGIVGAFFTLRK